jgi:hypothetical protein
LIFVGFGEARTGIGRLIGYYDPVDCTRVRRQDAVEVHAMQENEEK